MYIRVYEAHTHIHGAWEHLRHLAIFEFALYQKLNSKPSRY